MNKIEAEKLYSAKGKDIYLFHLTNDCGTCVDIMSYGATIVSIKLNVNGIVKDVILGYEKIEDYFLSTDYLGATIGRYANRISFASFRMDGKIYSLDKNDGEHCNHGGFSGFHQKVFDHKICDDKLIMSSISPNGEAGFPANLLLQVTYSLTEQNELKIDYNVTVDSKTPVNITNHTYFNLSGEKNILSHQLKIESDNFLESDDQFLPTGRILRIENNPGFDFRSFSKINEKLTLKKQKIKGYNTYFISREKNKKIKKLATLRCNSGVCLEIHSTFPGVMIYTGDYLSGKHHPLAGISIEAHGYPDSINKYLFPQNFASPNIPWTETIIYRFVY